MGMKVKDRHVAANAAIHPSKIVGGVGSILRHNTVIRYVDGTNGSDSYSGTVAEPFATIQKAVTAVGAWGIVYVFPKAIAELATDPGDYAETVIIPQTHEGLSIIGVGNGPVQGGLPQMKIGAGTTPMIDIRAAGCTIMNMGINGASSTGGGILLSDNGTTLTSFGTVISNCHFKNCKTHATAASGGGAIYSSGAAWQVLIENCDFYKCVGGVVISGSGYSVAQDWKIRNCTFSSSVATDVDCDIFIYNCLGLSIEECCFATVDVPSKGSSAVYIKIGTGTFGMISNCTFACVANESGTPKTFGVAGTGAVIPTTVRISKNWGETGTGGTMESGEIYRT